MSEIDEFFGVIGQEVARELEKVDPNGTETLHWVVIADSIGTATSRVEGAEPHEVLGSFMAEEVEGAAYVTYVPGCVPRVLAYAVVADPSNSDIRQAAVVRQRGSVTLDPWEYTV